MSAFKVHEYTYTSYITGFLKKMYKVTEIGVENVHIIGLCLKIYVIVQDFFKMFFLPR